ncbi:hypothetical protein EOJ36_10915 [Sandaracinomonas limnophila]|uniref:Uncharacterized protein n=1 Tax=Sandaracinomonas limnophila TaxID=1862386 RepID=A0A437PMT5_9BACT|nr:hypothetical protein [Sandaracinomonas limnophila]RVU23580.1 hypothetical protein EOJ36_10915 [Sandaracinomonas limnophila]
MEVHHPHHIPKKFKEYLTEFLMLFAAVTLGFLAENQREHYVEGHRAEELAQALLKDLVQDSTDFHAFQQIRKEDMESINQAIDIMDTKGISPNDSVLYYHVIQGVFVWRYHEFRLTNLNQIISSGSLRYFKNDELIQAVSDLNVELKKIEFRQDREKSFFYSDIQPFIIDHVEMSYADPHRKGMPRNKFLQILKTYPSSISQKDYFFNYQTPGFVKNSVNKLRGYDWMMNITNRSYYNNYKIKSQALIKLLRKNFPNSEI